MAPERTSSAAQRLGVLQNAGGARPGIFLGPPEHRTQRQAELNVILAPMARRRSTHLVDGLRRLLQCLTPECEDVCMLARDRDSLVGGTPEENGQVRLLHGLYIREAVDNVVICTLMIERLGRAPALADDVEIFVGARIALFLAQEVAIALLLCVRPAGDDMDGQATAGKMVERSELSRGQRRRNKARPMRQKEVQTIGLLSRIGNDLEAVPRTAEIADEHTIEPGRFVRAG